MQRVKLLDVGNNDAISTKSDSTFFVLASSQHFIVSSKGQVVTSTTLNTGTKDKGRLGTFDCSLLMCKARRIKPVSVSPSVFGESPPLMPLPFVAFPPW